MKYRLLSSSVGATHRGRTEQLFQRVGQDMQVNNILRDFDFGAVLPGLTMDSGEYVSGLKRQIKSLKQHNSALERKVLVEARDAEEKIRSQDAKIRVLEHDVEKLKNPTRAALKGVFYGFGRKSIQGGAAESEAAAKVANDELVHHDESQGSTNLGR